MAFEFKAEREGLPATAEACEKVVKVMGREGVRVDTLPVKLERRSVKTHKMATLTVEMAMHANTSLGSIRACFEEVRSYATIS